MPIPKVFLSHSSHDRHFIEKVLLPVLHQYDIGTWYAQHDIQTANEWEQTMHRGLTDCDWFLVILSPAAAASKWVKAELQWALQHRSAKVIPVLLEDCQKDEISLQLRLLQHIDFRADREAAFTHLLKIWDIPYLSKKKTAAPSQSPLGLPGLTLAEQFFILQYDGEAVVSAVYFSELCSYGLPGMALAELALLGKITITKRKDAYDREQFFIAVTDHIPVGNALLDLPLANLAAKALSVSNPFEINYTYLDEIFGPGKRSWLAVLRNMESRGILQEQTTKSFFGLLSSTKFYITDNTLQRKARQNFANLIIAGDPLPVEIKLSVLFALCCGFEYKQLDKLLSPQVTAQMKMQAINSARDDIFVSHIASIVNRRKAIAYDNTGNYAS